MTGEVWVWAEQRDGRLMGASLEILGKGCQLAEKLGVGVAAVLPGVRGSNPLPPTIAPLAFYSA